MKDVSVDRDSWHYWLADKSGFDPDWNNNDICTYLRHIIKTVIGCLFGAVLGLALTVLVAWIFGDFIAWAIFVLLHGWIAPDIASVAIGVLSIGAGCAIAFFGGKGAVVAVDNVPLARAAWDSLHNKICARVYFR